MLRGLLVKTACYPIIFVYFGLKLITPLMRVCQLLLVGSSLLAVHAGAIAQQPTNPKDTTYIMALLRKAEAVEMQQPDVALRDYQRAHAFAQRIGTRQAILRASG